MKTLPVVFVGINPGVRSVEVGHYFATPQNRFWTALNRSRILEQPLTSEMDYQGLDQGIGFTDVVKRPSNSASKLRAADFRTWAPVLKDKLERFEPLIVCFNGVTGYRLYLKYAEGVEERPRLGLQSRSIGRSTVFVVPNPSPANAAYSLDVLAPGTEG